MITPSNVLWGSYRDYEGPWHGGTARLTGVDEYSDFAHKALATITATEGGTFNAINMYDAGIFSAGLIQWIESGQYSVSEMLGYIVRKTPSLAGVLNQALEARNCTLKANANGRIRFFFRSGTEEVDTLREQQELFLYQSTGKRGSWNQASKDWAKGWVAEVSNFLEMPEAREGQIAFTLPKLVTYFVMKPVIPILFSTPEENSGRLAALRAIYLSYAANNPLNAAKSFEQGLSKISGPMTSEEGMTTILRELVFHSGFTIWPERYNKIRPVVERLFGVDIPDLATDLKRFEDQFGGVKEHTFDLTTTVGVQKALLELGYDIGPQGADGKYGAKTRAAIVTFQQTAGLVPDGIIGPKTSTMLRSATEHV
jgi:hypothetical protein